jgi:hypothetical protein
MIYFNAWFALVDTVVGIPPCRAARAVNDENGREKPGGWKSKNPDPDLLNGTNKQVDDNIRTIVALAGLPEPVPQSAGAAEKANERKKGQKLYILTSKFLNRLY